MSDMRQFRVTKRHKRGCFAVDATNDGRWDSPWTFCWSEVVYRTAFGTEGGPNGRGVNYRWHTMTCNDPGCGATALVREDVLMAAVCEVQE